MADYSTIKGFTIQSLASDPLENRLVAGRNMGEWRKYSLQLNI